MKKYLSLLMLLLCSCAFVYHAKGTDEDWENAYKMALDNIENMKWDLVEFDRAVFIAFNKNYFEKEGFKINKNAAVIISTMHNLSPNYKEPEYDPFKDLINSVPCIIYVNNVNVNPKKIDLFYKKISSIEKLEVKDFKFKGFIKPFYMKEDMFYQFHHDIFKTYHEHKKIIFDKSITYDTNENNEKEEINKMLIEKGYTKYKNNPLNDDDLVFIGTILAVLEGSEKYYQLGYKYPCFECSL